MTRNHRRPAARAIAIAKTDEAKAAKALLFKLTLVTACALVAVLSLSYAV